MLMKGDHNTLMIENPKLLSRDPTAMMKMVDLQYICCTHWAGSGPQLELQRAWPAFSTPGFVMITSERLRTINAEIESRNIDCPFSMDNQKKKSSVLWLTAAKKDVSFVDKLHRPGIEPGSRPWQGRILPLDQRCQRR